MLLHRAPVARGRQQGEGWITAASLAAFHGDAAAGAALGSLRSADDGKETMAQWHLAHTSRRCGVGQPCVYGRCMIGTR